MDQSNNPWNDAGPQNGHHASAEPETQSTFASTPEPVLGDRSDQPEAYHLSAESAPRQTEEIMDVRAQVQTQEHRHQHQDHNAMGGALSGDQLDAYQKITDAATKQIQELEMKIVECKERFRALTASVEAARSSNLVTNPTTNPANNPASQHTFGQDPSRPESLFPWVQSHGVDPNIVQDGLSHQAVATGSQAPRGAEDAEGLADPTIEEVARIPLPVPQFTTEKRDASEPRPAQPVKRLRILLDHGAYLEFDEPSFAERQDGLWVSKYVETTLKRLKLAPNPRSPWQSVVAFLRHSGNVVLDDLREFERLGFFTLAKVTSICMALSFVLHVQWKEGYTYLLPMLIPLAGVIVLALYHLWGIDIDEQLLRIMPEIFDNVSYDDVMQILDWRTMSPDQDLEDVEQRFRHSPKWYDYILVFWLSFYHELYIKWDSTQHAREGAIDTAAIDSLNYAQARREIRHVLSTAYAQIYWVREKLEANSEAQELQVGDETMMEAEPSAELSVFESAMAEVDELTQKLLSFAEVHDFNDSEMLHLDSRHHDTNALYHAIARFASAYGIPPFDDENYEAPLDRAPPDWVQGGVFQETYL